MRDSIGCLRGAAVGGWEEQREASVGAPCAAEKQHGTMCCGKTAWHTFAAGPGAFDFVQSDTNGTAFWRLVRNFIRKPSKEQEACHAPKPILLDVGESWW